MNERKKKAFERLLNNLDTIRMGMPDSTKHLMSDVYKDLCIVLDLYLVDNGKLVDPEDLG